MSVSPYSHFLGAFGAIDDINTGQYAVGASVALTTQQGFCVNPFPYCYVYDILIAFTGTGAGAITADIYNTVAAGSSANSYLTTPFVLTPSISATPTIYSAKALGILQAPSVEQIQGPNMSAYIANYVYTAGQVFSLRASTPSGSSITNLQAIILVGNSDLTRLTA